MTMSNTWKICTGVLAFFFFIMTVVGLFLSWPGIVLALLILMHSLCLIMLAFIFSTERVDTDKEEELTDEIENLKSERENEIATMQRALDVREVEINEKLEELKKLKEEAAANEQKINELKTAVMNAKSEINELEESTGELLPPATDDPIMVDIIKVAQTAVDDLAEAARNAGLTVRISSAEESIYVKAQTSRLLIMFKNIIDNSIKYMNRTGSLVITISTVDDDIFIVMKDTGAGLKEEETKHIFELNYQGSNRISGNGLGLTQAKAIVDFYGGTIYGKSMPDKGMGIYIQLPTSRRNREEVDE